MRRLAILFLFLLATTAHAASLQLTHASRPLLNTFELLTLTVDEIPPGATAELQDARGGPTISRPLTQTKTLLPLPFLAPSDLPPNAWPVTLRIKSATGQTLSETTLNVPRPETNTPRILTSQQVSDDDILTGPLLLFASTDILQLSDNLAQKLPADRAAALLATGIRLQLSSPPPKNLFHLPWQQTNAGYLVPSTPLPRPVVVDPKLARTRSLQINPASSRKSTVAILLSPLIAILLLILARSLFRRPFIILLATALALIALPLAIIGYLRAANPPATRQVAWSITHLSPALSDPLVNRESFTAIAPLFATEHRISAPSTEVLYPIAASPRQFFAMTATLALDVSHDLDRTTQLTLALPARSYALFTTHSTITTSRSLPPKFFVSQNGRWIIAGHVSSTGIPDDSTAQTLPQYAADHPGIEACLRAFDDLRLTADDQYFLESLSQPASHLDLIQIHTPPAPTPLPLPQEPNTQPRAGTSGSPP